MIRKILVPLDQSVLSENALPIACKLAEQCGATLVLAYVPQLKQVLMPGKTMLDTYHLEMSYEPDRAKGETYLHRLAELTVPQTVAVELCVPAEGGEDVAAVLADALVSQQVDMVVMTTHGYTGVKKWALGSVTEKLLHTAVCPVLVVRGDPTLKHIVVTLDGSKLAEMSLPPAVALAKSVGARLTLLRVEEPIDPKAFHEFSQLEHVEEDHAGDYLRRRLRSVAADYLLAQAEALQMGEAGLMTVDTAVVEGKPAEAILSYVNKNDVDLLAISTHGRTGLRRWLYGSVTQKVLHQTPTSLLVVRPPDEALK